MEGQIFNPIVQMKPVSIELPPAVRRVEVLSVAEMEKRGLSKLDKSEKKFEE